MRFISVNWVQPSWCDVSLRVVFNVFWVVFRVFKQDWKQRVFQANHASLAKILLGNEGRKRQVV